MHPCRTPRRFRSTNQCSSDASGELWIPVQILGAVFPVHGPDSTGLAVDLNCRIRSNHPLGGGMCLGSSTSSLRNAATRLPLARCDRSGGLYRTRASVRGNELAHDIIPIELDRPVLARYGLGLWYATA
jgi:hypothetical protein